MMKSKFDQLARGRNGLLQWLQARWAERKIVRLLKTDPWFRRAFEWNIDFFNDPNFMFHDKITWQIVENATPEVRAELADRAVRAMITVATAPNKVNACRVWAVNAIETYAPYCVATLDPIETSADRLVERRPYLVGLLPHLSSVLGIGELPGVERAANTEEAAGNALKLARFYYVDCRIADLGRLALGDISKPDWGYEFLCITMAEYEGQIRRRLGLEYLCDLAQVARARAQLRSSILAGDSMPLKAWVPPSISQ